MDDAILEAPFRLTDESEIHTDTHDCPWNPQLDLRDLLRDQTLGDTASPVWDGSRRMK